VLFNSYVFLFAFLPVTLGVYLALQRVLSAPRLSFVWLGVASIVFYAYWSPVYGALILASILVNFGLGARIAGAARGPGGARAARPLLWLGVALNLAVLGYFKYTNFAFEVLRDLGLSDVVTQIVLPIGLSFFTFQQIAYLVDSSRGETVDFDFVRYLLFVTFFPQLIAGPIVHHHEMMPQFYGAPRERLSASFAIGATIFTVGLLKKVGVADTAALAADPVFAAAETGAPIAMLDAWAGMLAYSVQLYFDFSGYSDMAVGLARLFGVVLPMNFAAPYQAASIVDFWRRWHITLSRFLRDYLYVALGGNRGGAARRYANVFVTMLLGGIWHGAGWTFVVWGALHGAMIVVNQVWTAAGLRLPGTAGRWAGWALTMLCVTLAWVAFRAETLGGALAVWRGLADLGSLGDGVALARTQAGLAATAFGLALAAFAPTIHDTMRRVRPVLPSRGYPATFLDPAAPAAPGERLWSPSVPVAVALGAALAVGVVLVNAESPFLYFQF
jgi:D-alanyl-lipoteichoic acid acyltransferase DltB (MBOAT superfamily)